MLVMVLPFNANGIKTFFIIANSSFNNGPISLPRSLPDCTISNIGVFDNFILAVKIFAKALRSLETCPSINNNLCE